MSVLDTYLTVGVNKMLVVLFLRLVVLQWGSPPTERPIPSSAENVSLRIEDLDLQIEDVHGWPPNSFQLQPFRGGDRTYPNLPSVEPTPCHSVNAD